MGGKKIPNYPTQILGPGADAGFPAGGAPTLEGGATYDFAKFSKNLHAYLIPDKFESGISLALYSVLYFDNFLLK